MKPSPHEGIPQTSAKDLMSDFVYRGHQVTDDWPTASRVNGATKPDTERYFTHLDGDRCVWANTQQEMREVIRTHLESSLSTLQ